MKLLNVDLLSGTSLTAEFARRPLVLAFIGLAVGVAFPTAPGGLIVLIGFLAWLRSLGCWSLLVIPFLLGLLISPSQKAFVLSQSYVSVKGRVASVPSEGPWGFRFHLASSEGDFLIAGENLAPVGIGQKVVVKGMLGPFSEGSQNIYLQRGLQGRIKADSTIVVDQAGWIYAVSDLVRRSTKLFLSKTLNSKEAALAGGLCLSLNGAIEPEMMESLKSTGTIHLISASGLHIMILASGLYWLFGFLPIPRLGVLGGVGLVLLIYGLASGLHPPVVRSICITLLSQSAFFFRREFDLWSGLALVGGSFVIVNPRVLFEIGFQLSFIAVAFFGMGQRSEGSSVKAKLVTELKSTGVGFLSTIPILAQMQGFIGLTSPFANLLLVFILPWILFGTLLGGLLFLMSVPASAFWMRLAVEPLLGWIEAILHWTSVAEGQIAVPAFSGYFLLFIYGFAVLSWRRKRVEA